MRFVQALMFLVLLGALGIFAVQNTTILTFRFMNWQLSGPVALLAVGIYLLGMISGWTVVAFAMRSVRRVGENP